MVNKKIVPGVKKKKKETGPEHQGQPGGDPQLQTAGALAGECA